MTIGESIKKARHARGLLQREVASLSNTSVEAIGSYEIDEHVPRLDAALMMADGLNMSMHELFTGKATDFKIKPLTMKEIGINAKKHRASELLSRRELAEKAYIAQETIRRFESAETSPQIDTLLAICDVLNITLDEYIGRV